MYTCSSRGCEIVVLSDGTIVRPCAECDAMVYANLKVALLGDSTAKSDVPRPAADAPGWLVSLIVDIKRLFRRGVTDDDQQRQEPR